MGCDLKKRGSSGGYCYDIGLMNWIYPSVGINYVVIICGVSVVLLFVELFFLIKSVVC